MLELGGFMNWELIKFEALFASFEKSWFLARGSVPAARSSGSIWTFSILNLLVGDARFLSD